MEINDNVVPLRRMFQCASCGSKDGISRVEPIEFDYGRGNSTIRLKTKVVVEHCNDCGEQLLGDGAEDIKHAIVCEHLGVLTPKEILGLRKSLGLTREQLSELTGIGSASIARWELGKLIQNTAYDRLLRLLSIPGTKKNLEALISQQDDQAARPIFKCLVPDEKIAARAANYEFS